MFPKTREELEMYFAGCAMTGLSAHIAMPHGDIVMRCKQLGKLLATYMLPVDPNAAHLAPATQDRGITMPGNTSHIGAPLYSPLAPLQPGAAPHNPAHSPNGNGEHHG